MRLVDYVREPEDFARSSTRAACTALRQEEYEGLAETPFFVGVPREVFDAAKTSQRIRDVARGRQGLATADDRRFLAGVDAAFPAADHVVSRSEVTGELSENERLNGVAANQAPLGAIRKGRRVRRILARATRRRRLVDRVRC